MIELKKNNLDYSNVLSAVAYDMRNSLTIMFQSMQNLANQSSNAKTLSADELADMNYQVQRLNGGLTQLMALYSVESDKLNINLSEQSVADLLESVICQNDLYTKSKNIDIAFHFEEDVYWSLDFDLVSYLMDDLLSNAIRYSKEKITLTFMIKDGVLNIIMEDDSAGYPQKMLDAANAPLDNLVADYGRVGIGLLFSKLIVLSHQNKDKHGKIRLSNTSPLGGSTFVLQLP